MVVYTMLLLRLAASVAPVLLMFFAGRSLVDAVKYRVWDDTAMDATVILLSALTLATLWLACG